MLNVITPNGRILVKEIEVENKSAGGIILTETSDPDNKARLGEIVYNGIVEKFHADSKYAEGNKVYFGKYAGETLVVDGVKYISMLESEIVGITKQVSVNNKDITMTIKERNKLLIEAHTLLDGIEITISEMFASVNKQTCK